jgi:hypothetical protein
MLFSEDFRLVMLQSRFHFAHHLSGSPHVAHRQSDARTQSTTMTSSNGMVPKTRRDNIEFAQNLPVKIFSAPLNISR